MATRDGPVRNHLLLLLAVLSGLGVGACVEEGAEVAVVFTQVPTDTRGAEPNGGFGFRATAPDGSRIVLLKPARPGTTPKVLTADFAAACDPCVSFDGTRLLFAAKKSPGDEWNVWEMGIDGSQPRQVTRGLGDCREPEYLARSSITPPEFDDKVPWVVFTSTAAGHLDESGLEAATALYVQSLEPIEGRGTVTWRTTFNLSHDFSPTALEDGRVLFSSWQQAGGRSTPYGKIALMAANWAGTGLNAFYGNHQGAKVNSMAREMPNDRTVVFVESDGSTADGSGQLASVSFKRPLRSRETLSDGSGRYLTPHPLPEGALGVSYTPAPDERSYGIYLFDYAKKSVGQVLYDDPEWDDIDAVAVVPRPEPMGRITIVVDSKETGHLQCLNVYESDRLEAGTIEKGDVKRVRIVEGLPPTRDDVLPATDESGRDAAGDRPWSFAKVRILGEAPVESDGSFYVEVPGDTPFYVQTLDEDGMALQTLRGWIWVRRGSRRGCIGCHENKELSPENRATQALLKAKATSLLAPPEERRTVDFRSDVAPIVEAKCAGCHGGRAPKGGLDLGADEVARGRGAPVSRAYENLMRLSPEEAPEPGGVYVRPGSARSSLLTWLLLDAPRSAENPYPANRGHPYVALSDHEKRVFVEWIDLGAQWSNESAGDGQRAGSR